MGIQPGELKARYYAALTPVLGTRLQGRRVAVVNLAAVAGAAERLADCRVLHWLLCDSVYAGPQHPLARLWGRGVAGNPAGAAFAQALRARTPWEDGWDFAEESCLTEQSYPELLRLLSAQRPDLLLGGGDTAALRLLGRLARALDLPAVLIALGPGAAPRSAVLVLLPGDGEHGRDVEDLLRFLGEPALPDPATLNFTPERWFNWQEANASAAALARAVLLQGSTFAQPDLTRLLFAERRTALVQGAPGWPWLMQYLDLAQVGGHSCVAPSAPEAESTATAAGPLLIVGCGSLGSHAARTLIAAGAAREIAVVDGGMVDASDLCCEYYTSAQVGRNKAEALAQQLARLAPASGPDWMVSIFDHRWSGLRRTRGAWTLTQVGREAGPAPWFEALLDSLRPAAVILTMAGAGDAALARLLRARGIPHVVGRCDAHAAYFEVAVVDGRRGPCLGCLRDAIFPPPRRTAATVVETGRAADLIARLAWQLSLAPAARAPWFARLLADQRTALIGGNGEVRSLLPTERALDRETPRYGLTVPGQVVARGPFGGGFVCPDCGDRVPSAAYGVPSVAAAVG